MGSIFFEVTILISLAALLAIVFRIFKQPTILAYIATGLLIGPFAIIKIHNLDVFQSMADLGITLLLFLFGLELKFSDLASIGKVALFAGIVQVVLTALGGFVIAQAFHFAVMTSLYLSLAVTISSTVFLLKLLSDKGDMRSLYGKIAIGVSLVQDFFAILILIFLSGYTKDANISFTGEAAIIFLKTVILFTVVVWLGRVVLPRLVHIIARSQEILFLFSLAWVFGVSAIVSSPYVGFSIEIGGLVAGIALANSIENFQIVAKLRPLRDFFVIIFFIYLGMEMGVGNINQVIIPAIVLSFFALVAKPLLVIITMGLLGYRKRTAFFTGTSIAQISELSLIIVVLGNKLGYVSANIVSLVTIIGIITFIAASYLIRSNLQIYRRIGKWIPWLEGKAQAEHIGSSQDLKNHIVLVGATRMGSTILDALRGSGNEVIVVDFDPTVVESLRKQNINVIFGDIIDQDIQDLAHIDSAKLVISTLSDVEDNTFLIKAVKKANKKTKIVVMAYDIVDANVLYDEGVDYVVLPHIAGGRQIARTLKADELEKLEELREKDKMYLV